MMGDERVRFCSECNLSVYNLSSMTRSEAETLIARSEGRLCVKFYRRRDGAIITQDCPVGLRAMRRRVSHVAKAFCSMLFGLMAGLGVHQAFSSSLNALRPGRTMGVMAERVKLPSDVQDPQLIPEAGQFTTGRVAWVGTHRKSKRTQSR
jgi:hypothetical protein